MELGASPSTEQARDIMASVDRIEGWLRDMVSFVHVDSSASARIDAQQLLQDCFAASASAFQRAGIQAKVEGSVQDAAIRADRALLGHVIHSLIANAIEATAPGGRVTGEVTRAERRVLLRIADTGSGIAPENLRRLFSLFFTTKPRGLGIGLTLAHRAIERIGGSIRVDSTVGAGTSFTPGTTGGLICLHCYSSKTKKHWPRTRRSTWSATAGRWLSRPVPRMHC